MRMGVALFGDAPQGQGAAYSGFYCLPGERPEAFEGLEQLPQGVPLYSNLEHETIKTLGDAPPRLREAAYYRTSYENLVRDFGLRSLKVPKSKSTESDGYLRERTAALSAALDYVHSMALRLGLPEAPPDSLAIGFRRQLLGEYEEPSISEKQAGPFEALMVPYVRASPPRSPARSLFTSLTVSRFGHFSDVLSVPRPEGPWRKADLATLPADPAELARQPFPVLCQADVSGLPEIVAELFPETADLTKRWLSPYELAVLSEAGPVKIVTVVQGKRYLAPPIALPALPPVAAGSQAMGLLLESLAASLLRTSRGGRGLSAMGAWLCGFDRAQLMAAALELRRAQPDVAIIGYGMGRVDVRLPATAEEPAETLAATISGSNFIPPAICQKFHRPFAMALADHSAVSILQAAALSGDLDALRRLDSITLQKLQGGEFPIEVYTASEV